MKNFILNLRHFIIICSLICYFPHLSYGQNELQSTNEPLTFEELQKKYPNAEIKQVPQEQLEAIKNRVYGEDCKSEFDYTGKGQPEYYQSAPVDMNTTEPNLNFNSMINYGQGGDKDFLILVALVGVIVVASLVIYSVGYVYQSSTARLKCLTWRDFGFRISSIDDRNHKQDRTGFMKGLYFSTGYRVPVGVMGLLGEVGVHSFDLTINNVSSISKNYSGNYLLLGPSFSIPFTSLNQNLFLIELLAGTSNNKDIGLMSTLRFGFSIRATSQLNIGLNVGAILLNIKKMENYIEDQEQLSYLFGTSLSYKW